MRLPLNTQLLYNRIRRTYLECVVGEQEEKSGGDNESRAFGEILPRLVQVP